MLRPHGVPAEALAAMLAGDGVTVAPVPLVADSLALPPGVALADLAPFAAGQCYVQDAGATLVVRYAHVPEGGVVADLCAAPGGKALELARRAALVVAADRQPLRVDRMLTGFGRLDAERLVTLVADATAPALAPVDAVLVDVPCTGTGTFRRHPDARWRLKVADLAVLGALQREILEAAATVVRPGGLLVYSTCSLEPEENDAPVDRFLAAHPEFTLEPPPPGTVPDTVLDGGRLRVLPHRHGVDGAFAARMRRLA
jgi:16S rRNA (cytosine967-C5)-methyltransferase